ncbi:ATP-dependent helicase [Nocardioides marmorisolisilvae]|uniref:DNA 3'-5' helicase n=1 Tax=Nocardioides marmorisolisilvae TaxID=1542737 RepID=A0A3N0DPF5_9ACTN|nr:ATP-dependent helicase [Nocardioides marmorisolisilvae]
MTAPTYRLAPPPPAAAVPVLDEWQQAVVDHAGGPLLVLAGPGTGKTTTLVEAIVDRVEVRGADPSSVLALTFSRKAADQLRDRVSGRLARTTASTMSSTFHSFAYGIVRELRADLYDGPLRLLSAPEADVMIAELLEDSPESVTWPEGLRVAARTRGFAREIGAVLARAREKGLDEEALVALGRDHGIEEFVAAGWFLDQYLANLDQQSATDYADLIRRAVILAESHRDVLRARYQHVFVDEYQDTDPGQVALLQAIAGDGANLTVVGDPYQSIYGFRGADVRGILEFPDRFRARDGSHAPIAVLGTTRRFGARVLTAAQRVAARIPLTGAIGADVAAQFLAPQVEPGKPEGRVQVFTCDTERAEVEQIADLLRRAHLEDGVDWSEMAVLVRSGRATIPGLRRALTTAGVPVEVASDETPLSREPAVQPLLEALRAATALDLEDVSDPHYLDPARAEGLLTSPLAGLDATDVRTLARALRATEKVAAVAENRSLRSSPDLIRAALVEPSVLDGAEGSAVTRARRLADLLHRARALIDGGSSVEEVLWAIWDGTGWPELLRRASERPGSAGRLAHRDLDAICALFESAARAEEQLGHASVRAFLHTIAGQEIPADTLADKGVRGSAVRLLTAHRSKGLEWRLVVVAHVQEGSWPDLRRRSTLLRAGRIGASVYGHAELQDDVTSRELLAEERRLFYVACTRARELLVVTGVDSADEDGEQASRFLKELLPLEEKPEHRPGRPPRPLSLDGIVSELRRTAADEATPTALRDAAVRRLALLAAEYDGARPLVPTANPGAWWGTRGWSHAPTPVRAVETPVSLSASALSGIGDCPAKWFLEREAGGSSKSSQSQGFGNVVHAVADRIARGDLVASTGTIAELMVHVDQVWDQLPFRTPWSRERERAEIERALTRFVAYHSRPGARTILATEQPVTAEVTLPDGQKVGLHGFADRLEIDADGRVVVVDLKTGKYPPGDRELAENPQLGLYQHAVAHGAVDRVLAERGHQAPGEAGGAELWHLRKDVRGELKVQRQEPQQAGEDGALPIERQLAEAVRLIRDEEFQARPGSACQHCAFTALCPAKNAGTVLS